jgi:hypothetical protein
MRQTLRDVDLDTHIVGVDAKDSGGANGSEHAAEDSPRVRNPAHRNAAAEIRFTPDLPERHRGEVRFGIPLYKSTTYDGITAALSA